jgi:TRAP-type C4-dicarboxylate transport system permease small subunit
MVVEKIKKWLMFFCGILTAIIIANWISNNIVNIIGISGWSRFLLSFILYAFLFFTILYALERIFKVNFFGLNKDGPFYR